MEESTTRPGAIRTEVWLYVFSNSLYYSTFTNLHLGSTAAKHWGVDYSLASYWQKKVEDEDFHACEWGGNRAAKYPGREQDIKQIIWNYLKLNQQPTLEEIKIHLFNNNYSLSRASISRLLATWRWSYKIPTITQMQKYTLDNLEYYVLFCHWLGTSDLKKLKFVDEVHFDPRGMFFYFHIFFDFLIVSVGFRVRKFGLAPIGHRVI